MQLPSTTLEMVRVLRPRQWLKNLLLLVPLLLAHDVTDVSRLLSLGVAFVAFCCAASAVYVLNDLLDREADRRHPEKYLRPLARDTLPLRVVPPLLAALLIIAFGLSAWLLPRAFSLLLATYVIVNVAYSLWLKRKPILDVLVLAGMYALRLLAGGAAVNVEVSAWLLAFSMFFFASLAFAKRYAELGNVARDDEALIRGRGYLASDISLIESMGIASGYVAILVLALYIHSQQAQNLYERRALLWPVCPLLLYWISRLWLLARRKQLLEDPVLFAVTDRVSLVVGIASVTLIGLAAWGK